MCWVVVCGVHWRGDHPLPQIVEATHYLLKNSSEGHSVIRENRINGAFAIGSDDLDAVIQVVTQRVADFGSVRARIRPQRCFGQHFIRYFDLYFSVDLMYESVITHTGFIPRDEEKCDRHVTASPYHHALYGRQHHIGIE